MRLKLASFAGCGMGISSDLPVTKPVAYLPTDDVVPAVAIAALNQTTLVVPEGVAVGADVAFVQMKRVASS